LKREDFMERVNESELEVKVNNDGKPYLVIQEKDSYVELSPNVLGPYLPKLFNQKEINSYMEPNTIDFKRIASDYYGDSTYFTEIQQEVIGFILHYREEKGISPTLKDITDILGRTRITIHEHLNQLERKGAISRVKYMARSVLPTRPD
jgi:hypothetical protein